jgi:hypothetical protein
MGSGDGAIAADDRPNPLAKRGFLVGGQPHVLRLLLLVQSARALRPTRGAGGGSRTHTTLPSRDFKSLASTSSATSALVQEIRRLARFLGKWN